MNKMVLALIMITLLMLSIMIPVEASSIFDKNQKIKKASDKTNRFLRENADMRYRVLNFKLQPVKRAKITVTVYKGLIPDVYKTKTNIFGKFVIDNIDVGRIGRIAKIKIEAEGYKTQVDYWFCLPRHHKGIIFIKGQTDSEQ